MSESDHCNQCDAPIEDSTARYCQACGAEIHPAEITFAPGIDENATNMQKILHNLKNFYFNIYFHVNQFFSQRTSNLFHKRLFLEANFEIMGENDLKDRAVLLDEINTELKEISKKIRAETQSIQKKYYSALKLYTSADFIPAKLELGNLLQNAKKLGFYSWVNESIRLNHQIKENIKCLRSLELIELPLDYETLTKNKQEAILKYNLYILTQCENYITKRNNSTKNTLKIHPSIVKQLQTQKGDIVQHFKKISKDVPEFNIATKIGYFFKSTFQRFKITLKLIKFNKLLHVGQDLRNLPQALQSLKEAEELTKNPEFFIYSDKKLEMKLAIAKIVSMIENYTKEKDETIDLANNKALNFEFEEALDILHSKEKYFVQFSLEGLIKELQQQQSTISFNKGINLELKQIKEVYETGDYLEAFRLIEKLKEKIKESQEVTPLLENIQNILVSLDQKISKSRNEGESLLIQEIEKTWNNLAEDLLFQNARDALSKSLAIASKQAYHSTENLVKQKQSLLELNFEIAKIHSEIKNLIQQKELKIAHERLIELNKMVKKNEKNIFEKLIQEVKSLEKELDQTINDETVSIKEQIDKAQELLSTQLEFFAASEILANCQIQAEKTGVNQYISIIEDLSQRIVENQRIQTEQVGYEAKIQENQLQIAKEGLTHLLKTVMKHKDKYEPLLIQNLQKSLEQLEQKIAEEEEDIKNRIEEFHNILDESLDFNRSEDLLKELEQRIQLTGLTQFNSVIQDLHRKLDDNRAKLAEYEELQKIFEEGDIHHAEKQAKSLLHSITSTNKRTPRFYCVALHDAVNLLNSEIQTALKDGKEKLTADFHEIQERCTTALDFTEILQRLKNYQIRAQRLGEEVLRTQIVVLENQVVQNDEFMKRHNLLAEKYAKMEDFIVTLREIKTLINQVQDNIAVFPQVKEAIMSLQETLENDNIKREDEIRSDLQEILESELNALDFVKAAESLNQLKAKSQSLAVNKFNAEINKYLLMCQSHKNFKIRIDNALVKEKSSQIMEARALLEEIRSDLEHHDSPVLDALRQYLDSNYNRIENLISKEIDAITKDVKGRLLKLVEGKQGEVAYFVLEDYIERAHYLEAQDLVNEISDLMKLCTLQFDPTDKKYQKKKKKKLKEKIDREAEIEQALQKTKMIGVSESVKSTEAEKPAIQRILVKYDLDAEEKTPHFETTKELREFKRKQRIMKQARVIKPPKVQENLNNQVRSSVTRARLQAFDRQTNRPLKRAENEKCMECGYIQHNSHNVFCEFCGKPL
ncbi:MAG: hypothetical protein DRO88_03665 [Promethearchaeia archaeon]|nr:MAG: hypothetical protein DRO88_03665 [Candidatus Lokiarchaeia archaeon]